MSLRLLIVGTMILAGCASPQNTPEPEVVQQKAAEPKSTESSPESFALEQGKAATLMFYAGELDALHARFSPAMSGAITAEQTKTALRVPFDGEWTVIWGGRTVEENYHSAYVGQRFAIDLVMTDETGRSYTGDGKKNEDYYAFGKPVLSPGKGRVIAKDKG